jgi:hypothetical protein
VNAPFCRTTYARATAGYDDAHERALVEAISTAIAEASMITDASAMVVRTGEVASALLTCLASVLALSPSVTRSKTAQRKMLDELGKRLRQRVAAAENSELRAFRERVFHGNDVGGNA